MQSAYNVMSVTYFVLIAPSPVSRIGRAYGLSWMGPASLLKVYYVTSCLVVAIRAFMSNVLSRSSQISLHRYSRVLYRSDLGEFPPPRGEKLIAPPSSCLACCATANKCLIRLLDLNFPVCPYFICPGFISI